jgi:hypothetical protein
MATYLLSEFYTSMLAADCTVAFKYVTESEAREHLSEHGFLSAVSIPVYQEEFADRLGMKIPCDFDDHGDVRLETGDYAVVARNLILGPTTWVLLRVL